MAVIWGSWAGPAGKRERVGIDLTASGTTITEKYYIAQESSASDNQTMKITGARSETINFFAEFQQAGGTQLVATRTRTGTRGTAYSYSATVTGIYTGATASVSNVSITVPAAPPSAPGQPSVSGVTSGKANIAWSAPSSTNGAAVTGYQIQFAYDSGFTSGVSTGSASSTAYTLNTSQANTTFWVRVRAQNSAGYGSWSTSRSFTTLPVAPAAPSGVALTRVNDTSQTVKWTNNPTSAAPYTQVFVNRRDDVATSWVRVATLSGAPTSFTDTSTVANRRYEYIVAASNSGGTSGWTVSTAINTTPAAPSNVAAVKSGSNIAVSWTRNATYAGVTQHVIQDNPGGTGWVTVATVGAVDSWTHTSVNASVTHQYRVLAKSTVNAVLDSAWSSASAVVQLLAPPLAPTVSFPQGSVIDRARQVKVSWTHVPVDTTAQTQYQLQWRLNGGAWTQSSIGNATGFTFSYDLPLISSSGTLDVQVRTRGEHATFGPWSAVKSVTLTAMPSVVINNPVDGSTLAQSKVTATWGYSNGDASPQTQWEANLYDSGSLVEAANGSGTTSSHTFARLLGDSNSYSVQVRVRSASGLWSTWAVSDFTTKFPLPVTVQPIPEWDSDTGSVSLTFTDPPVPATYAWTGSENASTSTMTTEAGTLTNLATNPSFETAGTTVEVWRNYVPNPSAESSSGWAQYNNTSPTNDLTVKRSGTQSRKFVTTAAYGGFALTITDAGVLASPAGVTTVGVWVLAASGTPMRFTCGEYEGAVSVGEAPWQNFVASGQWQYLSIVYTKVSATSRVRPQVQNTNAQGATFWCDDALVVSGLYPYTTLSPIAGSPDSDLTPSWTGTANDSASVLTGVGLAGVSGGDGRVNIQSSTGVVSGARALRVLRTGTVGQASTGAVVRTFTTAELGKTFTVAAWCTIPDGYDPSEDIVGGGSVSRGIYLLDNTAGRVQAPPTAGTHLVRATLTPTGTNQTIRLGGGGLVGQSVYWDMVTIVEGNRPDLMPWDGSTQSTTDAETITVQRRIGDGDWVTLADGLPVDGALLDPLPSLRYVNQYRAISKTALPTAAEGPITEVVREEKTWAYINWGPGFGQVVGVRGDPKVKVKRERVNAQFHMAGRGLPVTVFGANLTDSRSVSGTIIPGEGIQPEDLDEISWFAGVVCYRDPAGERLFGAVQGVDREYPGPQGFSLDISRTDYTEGG